MPAILVREAPPWESLRAPSGSDDTTAVNAKITALVARGGGNLILGSGTWKTATGFVGPTGPSTPVSIIGSAGLTGTVLSRTADCITLDLSGTTAGITDFNNGISKDHQLHNITISGSNTGTLPALRTYYVGGLRFYNVKLTNCPREAWKGCQVWDCSFHDLRVTSAGDSAGTYPAVVFFQRETDTPATMGYSVDTCNHLSFYDLFVENNKGGFWIVRNYGSAVSGTASHHTMKFAHMHWETTQAAHTGFRISGSYFNHCEDFFFYMNGKQAAVSAIDLMTIGSTSSAAHTRLTNVHLNGAGAASSYRTLLNMANASRSVLDNVWGTYNTGFGPTVALVDFSGSQSQIERRRVFWGGNPDSIALYNNLSNISSTAYGQGDIPVFAGAGKTTVSDSDFGTSFNTLYDGLMAVARNTTDGRTYLGTRINGSWRHVEQT